MASTCKCEYCGATISTNNKMCPNCGASNPLYVVDEERIITDPQTIEELQEYCAERGMPLARMRFFIGVDFKDPKAFGIYRAPDGDVVVYKNKADGTRAVRYKGRDERHAVNEIYGKLLEECHNRGIYPDGKSSTPYMSKSNRQESYYTRSNRTNASFVNNFSGNFSKGTNKGCRPMSTAIIVWVAIMAFCFIFLHVKMADARNHPKGYYKYNDDMYFRQGNNWYYYDDTDDDWYQVDNGITDSLYEADKDYYYGENWGSDWGSSFYNSDAYREYQESHSSSNDDDDDWDSGSSDSDWDDWDSGSTDWDSDW